MRYQIRCNNCLATKWYIIQDKLLQSIKEMKERNVGWKELVATLKVKHGWCITLHNNIHVCFQSLHCDFYYLWLEGCQGMSIGGYACDCCLLCNLHLFAVRCGDVVFYGRGVVASGLPHDAASICLVKFLQVLDFLHYCDTESVVSQKKVMQHS